MWLLSLEGWKLPGSAAARSRATDGFSAMTRVLLTRSSLACAIRRGRSDGDPRAAERRIAPFGHPCASRRARLDGGRPLAEPPDRAFQWAQGPVPTVPFACASASA